MANRMGIAREQEVFAVLEDTKGTLKAPSASDLVVAAGFAKIGQQPSFTDSPEIVNSRDIIAQFQDKTPAGTWSMPIIARPSGTPGTEPNGDPLYISLCGTKTVNAGTSVIYSLAMEKPSFSLWVKKSHTIFHASGCTVGGASVKTVATGGVTLEMNGKFMKLGWAGEDELAADAAAADTTITVIDSKKYTVGAMIQLENDDNGGAGYEVTDVDTSTNVLTVSPAIVTGGSAGDAVTGWLPTGSTSSTPLENRKSTATIGGSTLPVKSMDINITDDPQYLDDEITTDGYPVEYVETQRDVSGTLEIYFRQNDLKYFQDGIGSNEQAVSLNCGDTSGLQMQLSMSRVRLSVPEVQETDPTVALSMPIKALGTNGEDSFTITFS